MEISKFIKSLKGNKVIIFGTSPYVNHLLLNPFNIEVVTNTHVKYGFTDVNIDIPQDKNKALDNAFRAYHFDQYYTIGANLFSCYFPVDVAIWVESHLWLAKELSIKSKAKHLYTTDKVLSNSCFSNITDTFKMSRTIEKEYKNQLWVRNSVIVAAIHLAALGKPSEINIVGVDLDPLVRCHFYETITANIINKWVTPEVLNDLALFPSIFPDTKFYKANPYSYLPFEYKAISFDM
jgi:hypothetical protein